MKNGRKTTRREFGKVLGAFGVLGAAPVTAAAQETPPVTSDEKKETAKPSPATEALTAYVLAQYGQHVEQADRERLGVGVADLVRGGEALRKVVLRNADEPDFVFRAARDAGDAARVPVRTARGAK